MIKTIMLKLAGTAEERCKADGAEGRLFSYFEDRVGVRVVLILAEGLAAGGWAAGTLTGQLAGQPGRQSAGQPALTYLPDYDKI